MSVQFASIINFSPTAAQRAQARRERKDSREANTTGSFWRDFMNAAFNPYRPEDHYMRGPGPAWRAKHGKAAA